MRLRRWLLPFAFLVSSGIWSCSPYDRLQGEFNAGSADPFDWAPPYRTSNGLATNGLAAFGAPTGCARQTEGSCQINEFTAFVNGTQVGYFRFPFSPSQITTTQYAPVTTSYGGATGNNFNVDNFTPLRTSGGVPTPAGYVFDSSVTPPGSGNPSASDSSRCVAKSGYSYDPYRDAVHYDQQGNIFTSLPAANYGLGSNPSWTYTPVVAQVPVTSNGEPCQDIKSEYTVLTRNDVTVPKGLPRPDGSPTPQPDGNYLAWAIIDPGVPVFKVGQPANGQNVFGVNYQRWGWFNQFLVAYLDGGPIPTVSVAPNPTRYATQRLYYPRSINGTAANLGAGNDVMQITKGQPGYSPICQVISYAFTGAGTPPHDAATIEANFTPTFLVPPAPTAPGGPITPTFTFCLQIP
jgi:hypothetical protein